MYFRRVVKRRPASLTCEEWLQVIERGKLPRPDRIVDEADRCPAPDVYDLVLHVELDRLRHRLRSLCMALSKPNVAKEAPGSSSSSLSPGQLLSGFVEIWEFLTKPTYGDGTARSTGKVSLACSSAGLQVTLTDPTSNCYCCVTHPTLDDAFLALEVGLKDGSLPWRPSGYGSVKKK